jgi:glycosyltransferase involved in cell wall biosynthesis
VFYLEPKPLRAIYYLSAFIEILRIRPQVLHGFGVLPSGFLLAVTGRILQRPVILECIGSDVLLANPLTVAILWKFIFRSPEAVIAQIDLICKRVSPFARGEVDCIPNAIDISKFRLDRKYCRRLLGFRDGEESILYVGRLEPVKNVQTLLYAFVNVRKKGFNARLVLVGNGSEINRLRRIAVGAKVIEFVDFVGALSHDRVPVYMNAADVLVLPSRSEASPNVILEALAAGTPVIATRVGGIPDIVTNGKQGFLYSPGDTEQLTNLLSRLLKDKRLRARFSVEARIMAKHYSLDRINKRKFDIIIAVTSRYLKTKATE